MEAGVKYVKGSFVPLREFRSLADANQQLRAWVLGEAGNRIHGTTHERPLTRFVETGFTDPARAPPSRTPSTDFDTPLIESSSTAKVTEHQDPCQKSRKSQLERG